MKRTSIEEWILKELWNAYPKGATKKLLTSREMAGYIGRWEVEDNEKALALTECGEEGCNKLIGDWQDDCGGFYKYTTNGYAPVCKECCGPLTGDR